jgi:ribA/ribD-fused uncharacterized protein
MRAEIKGFFDEFRFLSNFHVHSNIKIFIDDLAGGNIVCSSIEHAFQASKTLDINERKLIATSESAATSKKLGKKATLRPDWELVKNEIMLNLLKQKFNYPFYKELLLMTDEAYLEETNSWHDEYWGICNGVGQNWLGKLLMQVREQLHNVKR